MSRSKQFAILVISLLGIKLSALSKEIGHTSLNATIPQSKTWIHLGVFLKASLKINTTRITQLAEMLALTTFRNTSDIFSLPSGTGQSFVVELSCDETVLLHSDQQTRTRYAELLLQTAGDERGFTTCLAASMDAMRYRLKSIVSPSKRATGSFIVAIITFILMITCGYVSLAYHETTGHEAIFHSGDMEQFSLVYLGMNGRFSRGEQVKLTCTDEVALFEYLSELQVYQITGAYALYEVDEEFTLDYLRPDGRPIYVDISKNYLRVTHPGQSWAQRDVYYIPDGADWEYLTSLFTLP